MKHSKFFYKNWETFLGEKFGWKDENFSIKNHSDKGRKLFFRCQKQAKSPLFSMVLACFRSTWNERSKSNCSTWNIGYFCVFSPLYIPLLSRFYLFYINIVVLGYVDFSRYLFVVFMGILVLNQVLFYGVLRRVFVALFERISPCLAQNRARFIGFLPPCHRVFRSQIGVF